MISHHIQRTIIYTLATTDKLRFRELKPDGIDNKLFTYHLHQVESAGLVQKNDDGTYRLTPAGKRLGIHVKEKPLSTVDRAFSVLILAIRRKDGAWLLYSRKNQPLLGLKGFMHVIPKAGQSIKQTAKEECLAKTGMGGEFTVRGSGFFHVLRGGEMESFTNFTLLSCEDIKGELAPNEPHADYFWEAQPDFSATDMLPNMAMLSDAYQSGQFFFIDKVFNL